MPWPQPQSSPALFASCKQQLQQQLISASAAISFVQRAVRQQRLLLLLLQATPKMEESSVVDNETGKSKKSTVRTSTGAFFARGVDEVVTRIEKRVAQVTMIPVGEQQRQQQPRDKLHQPEQLTRSSGASSIRGASMQQRQRQTSCLQLHQQLQCTGRLVRQRQAQPARSAPDQRCGCACS